MGLFGNRQQRIYNRCKWWQELSHWPNGASQEDLAGCVDKAFGRSASGAGSRTITEATDTGEPMFLKVDADGNPQGRWRYANGQEVPANKRLAQPCPTDCGGNDSGFVKPNTSRSKGPKVFDESGKEMSPKFLSVRYSDSEQQTSTETEARNKTVKFFAFVIIAVLAIKFASK